LYNMADKNKFEVPTLTEALLGEDVRSLSRAMCAALSELGGIGDAISDELVRTRLGVIQALQDSGAVFLWSQRERFWSDVQSRDNDELLGNPVCCRCIDSVETGRESA